MLRFNGRLTLRAAALVAALASGCDAHSETPPGAVTLTAWFHSGRESERITIREQTRRFNESQSEVHVDLVMIPEGAYNSQVQAAALSGDLPDLMELDGPFLYNYVWKGHLVPIDDYLPKRIRDDLIPSILKQGTYRGRLYSVGVYDSGLGLYGRRSQLEAVGARIPSSPQEAWTAEEFAKLLADLAERDPDRQVLDLKLNYHREWFTYAFSPTVQSAGGDLIDRSDYQSAEGVLNGPEAVFALTQVQSWIREGYVDPNLDDAAFTEKRVALSWVGHWEYRRYKKAIGEDLLILPLPDFGKGTRTGQGSWNWGVTSKCPDVQAAVRFLEFLLQTDEVLEMCRGNAAPPATRRAMSRSPLYRKGGPLELYATQLVEGIAVPRPRTPAYPVITFAFQEAFRSIRNDVDVKTALDRAVRMIDRDIEDNHGYPTVR